MNLKKILISGAEVWPIVEGGKGIGISNGYTCGEFARNSAVGTLSGVFADIIDENEKVIRLEYKSKTRLGRHKELTEHSIKAAISQIKVANRISGGNGRIHMNLLWEIGGIYETIHGILEGSKGLLHGVTCGAGMPYKLGEIASSYGVYYYPIVSSMRAFRILWMRSYKNHANFLGGVVYEDPWLAGGHNGISNQEDPEKPEKPYDRLLQIREFMNKSGLEHVPIIMAGSVWALKDWKHEIDTLAPIAFQIGTRPLLTKESPISDAWKKKLLTLRDGDVLLHRYSPTGFYSSAVKNNFLNDLIDRSSREVKYSKDKVENEYEYELALNIRSSIFISNDDKDKVELWKSQGYTKSIKTPDSTVIFVTPEKFSQIRKDQIDCMGCLSHCKFSNWKDHGDYTTNKKPDPRSFCIQKTLQNVIHDGDCENELVFSGHSVYKFSEDELYKDGNIPSIKELIETMVEGN